MKVENSSQDPFLYPRTLFFKGSTGKINLSDGKGEYSECDEM